MLDRRSFLALGLSPVLPYRAADPFTLGVASGDPAPDGFVLWTRLAPVPLAEDGLGGMPATPVDVRWEVATDPACAKVVRRGVQRAEPQWAHSVHVEVAGLRPGRPYWYRFKAGPHLSPIGRARTAPGPGAMPGSLRLAVASCANYQHGYFTAYARMAAGDPDLIVHLGDYLYEHGAEPGVNVRDHEGPEPTTLAGYRRRHALYKTDPDLRAAHAAAPWVTIMDDHEVANNWTNLIPPGRRAAAFRAYYEHLPLRANARPGGPAIQLYRRLRWGRLATFHLLDTRQHRDPHPCGHGYTACAAPLAPGHTMIGLDQENWLLDGFRTSRARWDLVTQQVFFGHRDRDPGPGEVLRRDAWDGYAASRTRVTGGWVNAGVRNAVVLTGDVHAHWAGNLVLDYDDPWAEPVGAEFAVTSVTSGGDGHDPDPADPLLAGNPHLRFHRRRRGYLAMRLTPAELTAECVVLPYVSRPGAAAVTAAEFTVRDRVPGLVRTAAP